MAPKIVMASTEMVQLYEDEVYTVLRALGHTEALVTDRSTVGDFDTTTTDEDETAWLKQVAKQLDTIVVRRGDYIWELARRIRWNTAHEGN